MRLTLALASGVVAGTLLAAGGAGATGVPSAASTARTVVQRVEYDWREQRRLHRGYWYGAYRYERGGYCERWRHECAERWGWGGSGFGRCLRWHDC
jgi:hypothetical protein